MGMKHDIYVGPMVVGKGAVDSRGQIAADALPDERLWSPYQEGDAHYWLPNRAFGEPLLEVMKKFEDGDEGAQIVEVVDFTMRFRQEFVSDIEALRKHYRDGVKVVFGVVSWWW